MNSVNLKIGDLSYTQKYHSLPDYQTDYHSRIITHLTYVLELLKMQSNSQQRQKHIDNLQRYISQQKFPSNNKYIQNKPCFQDQKGNICAVGYLIKQDIGDELVDKINQKYQYSYINQMNQPQLFNWVNNSGLSLVQLEMIQPTYQFVLKQRKQQVWKQYYQQFLNGKSVQEIKSQFEGSGGVIKHHKQWIQSKQIHNVTFIPNTKQLILEQNIKKICAMGLS